MSESLFLINPRRRKRAKKRSRKGRMPAGLRRYWASRRRGRKTVSRRRRRSVSVVRRRRGRRAVRGDIMMNPRRRHRRVVRRAYRRRHRNPGMGLSVSSLKHQLVPAATGALGAIALDVAYGYATPYLPASFQTGYVATAVKLAGAIGVGMLAKRVVGREKAAAITLGGLTVVAYGALKPLIASFAPTVKGLSGFADYSAIGNLGAYLPRPGMGAYMRRPGLAGLGFVSPAAVVGGGGMNSYAGGDGGWNDDGM